MTGIINPFDYQTEDFLTGQYFPNIEKLWFLPIVTDLFRCYATNACTYNRMTTELTIE